MADDDNKIVIPVEVETDDAKKALDDFANTASETFNRVVAKQASNAGITPEEFLQRGQDFANNGPKYQPPLEAEPDEGNNGSPTTPPDTRGDGRGGKEGHGVRYINVEQQLLGETSEGAAESTAGIRLFREALHALHPALAEAGIGVGELSALVSAARGGFVALGVAIGTLVATALERTGDAANDAAQKLGAFAGGISQGKEQYGRLSEAADQLKTPTSGLVAPFEQATRLNQSQPKEAQLPEAGLLEALSNVVKGGQSERADTTKVVETFTKFLSDGREKGFFGPDDFKALENIAPKTAAAIAEQLPKGQSTFSGAQVLGAVRAAWPQIDANSVEALALPDSISTAWEHVKASYEKLAEASSGGHALANTLDGVASVLRLIAEKLAAFNNIEFPKSLPPPGTKQDARTKADQTLPDVGEAPISSLATFLKRALTDPKALEDIQPTRGASFTAFDAESTAKLTPAADKAAEALDKLGGATDSLQKKMDEFHITEKDALEVKSKDLALRRAEIERKFEPKETENKLERDKLSVQNADIHLESAKISGLEAQKGQELSRLAPREARERVADAESRRDTALSKFFKNRGVDTTALDQVNAIGQDQRELDNAETALRRSRIEQKYAYLEEPKANLAAQQSETAIRSAELEKNDAHLRLAKDQQGAPISHELAQLNYSQALLDVTNEHTKYLAHLELLQDILAKLSGKTIEPNLGRGEEEKTTNETAEPAPTTAAKAQEDKHISRPPQAGEDAFKGIPGVSHPPQTTDEAFKGLKGVSHPPQSTEEAFKGLEGVTHPPRPGGQLGEPQPAQPPVSTQQPQAPAQPVTTQPQPETVTSRVPPAKSYDPNYRRERPEAQPQQEERLDPDEIQSALDKFRKLGNKLQQVDPEAFRTLQRLSPRSDGSEKAQAPITKQGLERMLTNSRQIQEYEGKQAGEFSNDIADQVSPGLASRQQVDRDKQHGIVPHPNGGKADLSERLYPGGPLRYRYNPDSGYGGGYGGDERGHYDENMGFVPDKHQPYARMRPHPYWSDQPYNKLEDTFDTKGSGDDNPIYNYGQPRPQSYPAYIKHLRDTLPDENADQSGKVPLPQPRPPTPDASSIPLPQPRPPEAPQPQAQQPQPPPPETGQQFAGLTDQFTQFIEAVSAKLGEATAKPVDQSGQLPSGAGIRGDNSEGDSGNNTEVADIGQEVDAFKEALDSLTGALQGAAGSIGSEEDTQHAASGGYIRGPGTSTSDSIPAMLSDKEYVHSAKATEHWGVDTMHELNALRVPSIFQHFNLGGLASRISRATAPPLALASGGGVARAAPSAAPSEMEHWGTVDMRTDHGNFKAATERDTMRHLSTNAQKAKRYSTGHKPRWYGGP